MTAPDYVLIDKVEETARAVEDHGAPWDGQWMADGNSAVRTANGHVLFYRHGPDPLKPGLADHVALNDPATVLRRCEVDRRTLARHLPRPDGTPFPDGQQCRTCSEDGGDGYQYLVPYPCPTITDLAHAHGLTDEIAGLDRPQSPEPKPRTDGRLGLGGILATPPITTSDVPAALRGPRWKP